MKAKFIALNSAMALILANGTIFNAVDGEKKAKFLKRVQADVELDLGELEIEELTTASFAKLSDAQLIKAASKEKDGLLKDLLNATIAERSVPKVDEKTKAKEEAAAKKAEEKEAKDKAKAEAAELKTKEKADKAAAKALVVKPTLEEITANALAAKVNVGHTVSFIPHGFATAIEGVVNGVWIDKRVPMALYRIFDADGVRYNKTIEAPELKFGEKAVDTKAEEKAKAKEEAAAKKAEEKEAKAKEKAKAAELKAKEKAEKAEAVAKIKTDKASAKELAATAKSESKAKGDATLKALADEAADESKA